MKIRYFLIFIINFAVSLEVHGDPLVSPQDSKEYKLFTLDNGLRVTLIKNNKSSPSTAAAALTVGVGSVSDVVEFPGLAHFCEHSLFLGSEKFPKESEVDEFLAQHGGTSNAITHERSTQYFFELTENEDENALEGALDRLSWMFRGPLMNDTSVRKEIQVIDGEWSINKQGDFLRWQLILKEGIMNRGHPESWFMWGNSETLINEPGRRGHNVTKTVREWFQSYYSPDIMTLAVQSSQPLDQLFDVVNKTFSQMTPLLNHGQENPFKKVFDEKTDQDLFIPGTYSKLIKYSPVSDQDYLFISFVINHEDLKPRILYFLGALIGNESEGSLLAHVKKLGLANLLNAWNEKRMNVTDFHISVSLTEAGYQDWQTIVETLFQFIHMISNLPDDALMHNFDNLNQAMVNDWKFRDEEYPQTTCLTVSQRMLSDEPVYWVNEDFRIIDGTTTMFRDLLKQLTKDSFYASIWSKKVFDTVDKIEPHSGSKYSIEELDPSFIERLDHLEPNPNLYVVNKNKFLVETPQINNGEGHDWIYPKRIGKVGNSECWFKGKGKFETPKGYVQLHLLSSVPMKSALNFAFYDLLSMVVNEMVTNDLYEAAMANLDYTIYPKKIFLRKPLMHVGVSGIAKYIPMIMDELVATFVNFNPTDKLFNMMRKQLKKEYYNMVKIPTIVLQDVYTYTFETIGHSIVQRRKILRTATKEQLIDFAKELYANSYFILHAEGNFAIEDIKVLYRNVREKFNIRSKTKIRKIVTPELLSYPEQKYFINIKNFNPADKDSAIMVHYQLPTMTEEESSQLDLVVDMMRSPSYDYLRTKQGLGYIVHVTCYKFENRIRGLYFFILTQVDKFSMQEVYQHIVDFIALFDNILASKTDKQIALHKRSFMAGKTMPPANLEEEFDMHSDAIIQGKSFIKDEQVDFSATKEELIAVFYKAVYNNHRVWVANVEGNLDAEAEDKFSDSELDFEIMVNQKQVKDLKLIKNISGFKNVLCEWTYHKKCSDKMYNLKSLQ